MRLGGTTLHPAVFGVLAVLAVLMPADVSAIPAAVQIGSLEPGNFTYTVGGPDFNETNPTGLTAAPVTVYQFPALEGQGVAMLVVNFDACSINLPHIHPRATEMIYMLKGKLRTAFVEELGGTRGAIVNDVSAGESTFFPLGLVHYQQNLECEEASYVAAVNSEDPGVVFVLPTFFALPDDAVEGSGVNLEDPTIAALVAGLPEGPAVARQECLKRCGLYEEEEHDDRDDRERMLRGAN